ncbi:exosortase Y [Pedobacter sp. MW01-1-1]|uniref:exosortase Y n=1 Tax=Pedobacter sp. MW01-1-1 TaxID=3383027 RepID=UPI003FF12585
MTEIDPIQAKKEADKKALKFVILLFALYILFSQGNILMNSMVTPNSRFYNAFLHDHLNYVQGLKTAIIRPSVWLIRLFGFYTIYNDSDILVVAGPFLRINYSCLGLGIMSFLAAFVIAFPASIKSSLKMLVFGFCLIYVLNVCRIAGLGILLAFFKSHRKYFEYHHEIFNIFIYIVVLTILYFWVKKNTKGNFFKTPTN